MIWSRYESYDHQSLNALRRVSSDSPGIERPVTTVATDWHKTACLCYTGPPYCPATPAPFASLTCRQERFIAVLGANWSSRSTWEQHTVVYPIGKKPFQGFLVPINGHTVIIVYSILVKYPKSKQLQGQQSSAAILISCSS